MRLNQMPQKVRLFVCSGLLMVTVPNLLAEYIKLPDFIRGFIIGAGIVIEIYGLIMMRRTANVATPDDSTETNSF